MIPKGTLLLVCSLAHTAQGRTLWLPCRPALEKGSQRSSASSSSSVKGDTIAIQEPQAPGRVPRLSSKDKEGTLFPWQADMTGQNLACQQRARLSHVPYSSLPLRPSGTHSPYSLRIIRQERGHTSRGLGLPSMRTASELGGGEEGRPNWQ